MTKRAQMRMGFGLLSTLAMAGAAAACTTSGMPTSAPFPSSPSTPLPSQSSAPSATAGPTPLATRVLLVMDGILTNDNDCLRVGERVLLFASDVGYEVVADSSQLLVRKGASEQIFAIGQHLKVTGGPSFPFRSTIPDFPHQSVPDHCEGPFWLVGSVSAIERPTPEPTATVPLTPTWADPYLSLVSSYPADDADGVPTETTIQFSIYSDLPVVDVSLSPNAQLERIPNDIAEPMGITGEVFIFRPNASLEPNTMYTVSVTLSRTADRDPDRTVTHEWEFTTSDGTDANFAEHVVIPQVPSLGEGGNAALKSGVLEIDGSCLWVGRRSHLPVFEQGTVWWEGALLFLRGHRYRIGEEVPLGGGESAGSSTEKFAQIPDDSCVTSKFWINVQ